MKITVKVPATTANLGPGFDALGLALTLWNEVVFETEPAGQAGPPPISLTLAGEGVGKLPTDVKNPIAGAALQIYTLAGKPCPGLRIHCTNGIPLSSGLGSSSAAMLSGLLGANALLGEPFSRAEILRVAVENEGHPDNVAPAMLGGLVASTLNDHTVITRSLEIRPLAATVVMPEFHFPTRAARAALPKDVPLKDAVYNISRAILVTKAFECGDLELLGQVMDDSLHQPYRLPLIPGAQAGMEAAKRAGAAAVALSGAGPSLVAFSAEPRAEIGIAMQKAFEAAGLAARIFELEVNPDGAIVHSI